MWTSVRCSNRLRRRVTILLTTLSFSFSLTAAATQPSPGLRRPSPQGRGSDAVLWVDFDFKNIPEPKARKVSEYDSFLNSQADEIKRATDIPRLMRVAVRSPKQALNVNALDEVPDSSWYTNRHGLRHMTTDQLVQGPNRGNPPDFSHATIIKAKLEGVTPGLQLTDNNGTDYLIKFDNKNYPELQSGAEVISTKILYAAGYNVPENYVAYLDPRTLEIKPGLEIGNGKSKHPFTRDDLEEMLQHAARRADGRYRVLASKLLKGKPKGPFAYIGLRSDDANDLIPHEHRRELRGLRVVASWINHWDLKEMNTLDMYVEEGGRKFLRHFLIDFGSSLGGGKSPLEYFHGREYALDGVNVFKELFTLGLYVTPDEKSAPLVFPEVGIFSAMDFDPGHWKPSFPVVPFENITRGDAFWATRVILSFSEDDLVNIVKTAEYSNPMVTDYMLKVLLERRQIVARYWLRKVNPIGGLALGAEAGGPVLQFKDLAADADLAGPAEYRYEMTVSPNGEGDGLRDHGTTTLTRIPLGKAPGAETVVRIWTTRDNHSSTPVSISVGRPEGAYRILRIDRS
jgi:hypothetical protein